MFSVGYRSLLPRLVALIQTVGQQKMLQFGCAQLPTVRNISSLTVTQFYTGETIQLDRTVRKAECK